MFDERSNRIPMLVLENKTLMPSMIMGVEFNDDKNQKAAALALETGGNVYVAVKKPGVGASWTRDDLFGAGTLGRIRNVSSLHARSSHVMLEGLERAKLLEMSVQDDIILSSCEHAPFHDSGNENEKLALLRSLKDVLRLYERENPRFQKDVAASILSAASLREALRLLGAHLPLEYTVQASLLEIDDLMECAARMYALLVREVEISRIRNDIQRKVKANIDKNQRDYILREQLKVIRKELGEELPELEADRMEQKVRELQAPEEVKERILKEIARLRSLTGNSGEASVSRTYIETLLDMPWDKETQDNLDLKNAAAILDEDHYGLEEVKERVLEYLAVRKLTAGADSPILCLIGPPGTGKTSIARSIARAMEKKYVRISLGGVRDEAEIRGHRRTYLGAMCGRIAAGLRSAGVKNPLMLLDEVDKLGNDYKGDPSSALLEVLDSDQNSRFRDHYIEIPVDLSKVLFIATANDLRTIPMPLRDRMEIIEIGSYTANEKRHIAQEHLLPKQKEKHGLGKKDLVLTGQALDLVIDGYTREAGVRQLERMLGRICGKAARQILEEEKSSVRVNAANLQRYLGRRKYAERKTKAEGRVGIATGLAWTPVGGDTLEIEVGVMPGKGELLLTGRLGDVMKESARTGISYLRSAADTWNLDENFFTEHDIHIHIPEGAVPKDGPSAGITMAAAMLSAFIGVPIRGDSAMTGEITLRGFVLPVGGLKEKLLSAGNAGIRRVLVPAKNRPDIEELSDEITGRLEIVYVQNMDEVITDLLEMRKD
ncbi:MAG: endopeptidase La [Lachnospiraceae bacterium]|nr:endopeptidase La [Lachnospiraceae bacterium]